MNRKTTAIILAAGTGKRMNSSVKKQYMEIAGYPVLYYTVRAFEESRADGIVIVTGRDETEYVQKEIVEKYGFRKVLAVCEGGRERFDSVYEGIKEADVFDTGYVLIHDGVRMLVTPQLINRCIDSVYECDACIAAVPAKDTLKEADTDSKTVVNTLDRSRIFIVQTPQCFEISLIKAAFEKMYAQPEAERSRITDDAMVVETYTDHAVIFTDGDYRNIKITTAEDLDMAEFLLKRE